MNVMILGRAIQGVGEFYLSSALPSVILSALSFPPVCPRDPNTTLGYFSTPLLHTSQRFVLPLFCSPLCQSLSSVCPASLSQILHWVHITPLPFYSLSSVCPRYYTGLVYTPLLHTRRRFGANQGVVKSESFLFSAVYLRSTTLSYPSLILLHTSGLLSFLSSTLLSVTLSTLSVPPVYPRYYPPPFLSSTPVDGLRTGQCLERVRGIEAD